MPDTQEVPKPKDLVPVRNDAITIHEVMGSTNLERPPASSAPTERADAIVAQITPARDGGIQSLVMKDGRSFDRQEDGSFIVKGPGLRPVIVHDVCVVDGNVSYRIGQLMAVEGPNGRRFVSNLATGETVDHSRRPESRTTPEEQTRILEAVRKSREKGPENQFVSLPIGEVVRGALGTGGADAVDQLLQTGRAGGATRYSAIAGLAEVFASRTVPPEGGNGGAAPADNVAVRARDALRTLAADPAASADVWRALTERFRVASPQAQEQVLSELQRILRPQMTATGQTDPVQALTTMALRGDARAAQVLGLMVLRPELLEAAGQRLTPGPIVSQQDAAGRALAQLASGWAPDATTADRRLVAVPREIQLAAAADIAYARLLRDSTASGPNSDQRRLFERLGGMQAQDGPEGRTRWFQGLIDDALHGSGTRQRDAQSALEHLASRNIPGADSSFRDAILRNVVNNYRPEDAASLPFIATLIDGRARPAAQAGGELARWREALNTVTTTLRQRMDAPGFRTDSRQAAPILDILAITAAGPGTMASEAANRLVALTNPANSRYSAATVDRYNQRVRENTFICERLSHLMAERDLPEQSNRHLLNIMHFETFARRVPNVDPTVRNGNYPELPFRHQEISNGNLAALLEQHLGPDSVAVRQRRFPFPISRAAYVDLSRHITFGSYPEGTRQAARDCLLSCGEGEVRAAERAHVDGLMTALQSNDRGQRERALSPRNLLTLVNYATDQNTPNAEVTRIVQGLATALNDRTGLDQPTRDRINQALISSLRQPTYDRIGVVTGALVTSAQQNNDAARTFVLGLATRAPGFELLTHATQSAQEQLLRVAGTDNNFRRRMIDEVARAPYLGTELGIATVMLAGALTTNSREGYRVERIEVQEARATAMVARISELARENTPEGRRAAEVLLGMATTRGVRPENPPPPYAQAALRSLADQAGIRLTPQEINAPGAFPTFITRLAEQNRVHGDNRSTQMLACLAMHEGLPQPLRGAAVIHLQNAAEGAHGNQVVASLMGSWQREHTAQAFELFSMAASRRSHMPGEQMTQVQRELREGYLSLTTRTPGMSDAEYGRRCEAAARSIVGNPRAWTNETITMLATHMTPQLAAALHHAELIPKDKVQRLLTELTEQANNPPPGTDRAAVATAIAAFARLAGPNEVAALTHLRQLSQGNAAQLTAVDRALYQVVTEAQPGAARLAAFNAIPENSPLRQSLSAEQRTALSSFANGQYGSINWTNLTQASARLGITPPLAASMAPRVHVAAADNQRFGEMADRIMARTEYGGSFTVQGWVMPLVLGASLGSETHQGGMMDLVSRLADGRPITDAPRLLQSLSFQGDAAGALVREQRQIRDEMDALRVQMAQLPANFQAAQAAFQRAQQAYDAGLRQRSPEPVQVADRRVLATFAEQQTRLETLSRRLGQLDGRVQTMEQRQTEATYHNLRAGGAHAQADAVLLQMWSRGRLPENLSQDFSAAWTRMRERGLTPLDSPPVFATGNGTANANFTLALTTLGRLSTNPDLMRMTPEERSLHTIAVASTADASMHAIANHPDFVNIHNQTERLAGEVNALMQVFSVAAERVQNGGDPTVARQHFVTQAQQLLTRLGNDGDLRQTVQAAEQRLITLRRDRENGQYPVGSVGRERLDQLITALEGQVSLFKNDGPIMTRLRTLMTQAQDGALDARTFWRQAGRVLVDVAIVTAAVAASAAIITATGWTGVGAVAGGMLLTSALTMVARHGVQESMYQLGVDRRGSEIFDCIGGRARFNPQTGRMEQLSAGQLTGHLAEEGAWELLMNAVPYAGHYAGAALGARYARTLASEGRLAYLAAETAERQATFMGRLGAGVRQEFSPWNYGRNMAIGMSMASFELGGAPWAHTRWWQVGSGMLLGGAFGFREGFRRTRIEIGERGITSFEHLTIPPELQASLGGDGRNNAHLTRLREAFGAQEGRVVEAMRRVPPSEDGRVIGRLLELTVPERGRALDAMTGLSAQQKAQFLQHLAGLDLPRAQNLLGWLSGITDEAQRRATTQRVCAIENMDALRNIVEAVQTLPEAERAGMLDRASRLPPQVLDAIALVPKESAPKLLETLTGMTEPNGSPNATLTAFAQTLARLPHQQQADLMRALGDIQVHDQANPRASAEAARNAIDRLVHAHDALPVGERPARTAELIQALLSIPEIDGRRAILETLGTASPETARRAVAAITGQGDVRAQGEVWRSLAGLAPVERAMAVDFIGGHTDPTAARTAAGSPVWNMLANMPAAERARVFEFIGDRANTNRTRAMFTALAAVEHPGALQAIASLPAEQSRLLASHLMRATTDAERVGAVRRLGEAPEARRGAIVEDIVLSGTHLTPSQRVDVRNVLYGITDAAERARVVEKIQALSQAQQRTLADSIAAVPESARLSQLRARLESFAVDAVAGLTPAQRVTVREMLAGLPDPSVRGAALDRFVGMDAAARQALLTRLDAEHRPPQRLRMFRDAVGAPDSPAPTVTHTPNRTTEFLNSVEAAAPNRSAAWYRDLNTNLQNAITSGRLTPADVEVISQAIQNGHLTPDRVHQFLQGEANQRALHQLAAEARPQFEAVRNGAMQRASLEAVGRPVRDLQTVAGALESLPSSVADFLTQGRALREALDAGRPLSQADRNAVAQHLRSIETWLNQPMPGTTPAQTRRQVLQEHLTALQQNSLDLAALRAQGTSAHPAVGAAISQTTAYINDLGVLLRPTGQAITALEGGGNLPPGLVRSLPDAASALTRLLNHTTNRTTFETLTNDIAAARPRTEAEVQRARDQLNARFGLELDIARRMPAGANQRFSTVGDNRVWEYQLPNGQWRAIEAPLVLPSEANRYQPGQFGPPNYSRPLTEPISLNINGTTVTIPAGCVARASGPDIFTGRVNADGAGIVFVDPRPQTGPDGRRFFREYRIMPADNPTNLGANYQNGYMRVSNAYVNAGNVITQRVNLRLTPQGTFDFYRFTEGGREYVFDGSRWGFLPANFAQRADYMGVSGLNYLHNGNYVHDLTGVPNRAQLELERLLMARHRVDYQVNTHMYVMPNAPATTPGSNP